MPAAKRESADHGPEVGSTLVERLFEEHHRRIFRIAYRITGNATDAEDALQTVFLRVSRRRQELERTLDPARDVGAYLSRAAVNAALDMLRARQRHPHREMTEEAVASTLGGTADPEALRRQRELASLLRRAVSRLSPRSAEIFSLRYFEGHANREIAAMLGTSQTAVAVVLHRCRGRLRKVLAGQLGGVS